MLDVSPPYSLAAARNAHEEAGADAASIVLMVSLLPSPVREHDDVALVGASLFIVTEVKDFRQVERGDLPAGERPSRPPRLTPNHAMVTAWQRLGGFH